MRKAKRYKEFFFNVFYFSNRFSYFDLKPAAIENNQAFKKSSSKYIIEKIFVKTIFLKKTKFQKKLL